jgi:hypothetical protein
MSAFSAAIPMRPDKRQQKLDHAACGIWPPSTI